MASSRGRKKQPELFLACVCSGLISTKSSLPVCEVIMPLCRARFSLSLDPRTKCPLHHILSSRQEDVGPPTAEAAFSALGQLCSYFLVSSPCPHHVLPWPPHPASSPGLQTQRALDTGQPWRKLELLPKPLNLAEPITSSGLLIASGSCSHPGHTNYS